MATSRPAPGRFCPAALLVVLAGLFAGCTTTAARPSRYAWGSYEAQIYAVYTKPGTLSPDMQAEQLENDRETARAINQRLPPGWHAHLAHVYFQLGRLDLAMAELDAEKAAFPESTAFVDRLAANMSGKTPAAPADEGSRK